MANQMFGQIELLQRVYDRFNVRDVESALAAMHHDVIWANGMEGGYVHGRDQVRNLNGNLLEDKMVGHVIRIEDGSIKRFDIRGI